MLSCGDNVLFCGLVHEEDVVHFPPELTDPDILSDIVNFSPNKTARVTVETDDDGFPCLSPNVEEFKLSCLKMSPSSVTKVKSKDTARTIFILKGTGKVAADNGDKFVDLKPGQAFFFGAGVGLEFMSGADGMEVYITSLGKNKIFES